MDNTHTKKDGHDEDRRDRLVPKLSIMVILACVAPCNVESFVLPIANY